MSEQPEPETIVNEKDGTELVLIPAGEFIMGTDEGCGGQLPQSREHLPDYYIGKCPVTNQQYRQFIGETGHPGPGYFDDDIPRPIMAVAGYPLGVDPANRDQFSGPEQPVVQVSCDDARAYCGWAGLRLPTEQEWEKAARGTDGRDYPWGNEWPDNTRCNFGQILGVTTEVGGYPRGASPYGCLDMAGNVWEWTVRSVLRGGAFSYDATFVCSARRFEVEPSNRGHTTGFRVCASPSQVSAP